MKNPERISIINNLIEDIWVKYPDMRYFQLLSAIQATHNNLNNRFSDEDCFHVEDDLMEATLHKILENGFLTNY